jgi:hypothetical protein
MCDSESHARFGFPSTNPSRGRSFATPLMRLRPLQGSTRHGLPTPSVSYTPKGEQNTACRQLSWSSLPLRRLSPGESTPPRLASPGTFRPQGFSPSRRIAPRPNVRPCFMPETPMGFFALQGLSLTARFPDSSPRNCLLDVSPHTNEIVDAWRPSPHAETRFSDLFRLQGLAPTANPYHRRIVTSCAMADPLLSFGRLSRVLPSLTGHVTGYVCHSCAFPALGTASNHGQAHDRLQRRPRRTAGKPTIFLGQCPRPTTGQARDRPRTDRMRSSGFARKRGIPLRRAKYPLLRFAAFLLQSLVEKRPTQCPGDQPSHSAFGRTYNTLPRAS